MGSYVSFKFILAVGLLLALIATSDVARRLLISLTQLPTISQIQRLTEFLRLPISAKQPVTFIDIDEETWEAWGRPALTPRGKLAELVDKVSAARPLAFLIDVDLSRPEAGDAKLHASIERFAAAHENIPVLSPREIVGAPGQKFARRETGFDNLPGITWLSVRFRTDENGMVSSWQPFEIVCLPKAEALLSPQLFITALTEGEERLRRLNAGLSEQAQRQCDGQAKNILPGLPVNEPSPLPFVFGNVSGPIAPLRPIYLGLSDEQRSTPTLFRLSAKKVADRRLSPAMIENRIVIIGASHSDSGDVHLTPFGAMPGPMILANAMAVGMTSSHDRAPGTAQRLAWSVALAGAAVLLFRGFQELPFVILAFGLAVAAYGLGASTHGPSFATAIVTDALSIFTALIAGLSMVRICRRWRSGLGWKALLKEKDG